MFNKLFQFFQKEEPEEKLDSQLLRVIMLLEAAYQDGSLADEEQRVIESILLNNYGLTTEEISELQKLAQEKRAQRPDIFGFTREINELMDMKEKAALLTEIWQVILADGVIGKYENHLGSRLKKLFRLDHEDWARARQKAEKMTRNSTEGDAQ